jgi:hypothetical protein
MLPNLSQLLTTQSNVAVVLEDLPREMLQMVAKQSSGRLVVPPGRDALSLWPGYHRAIEDLRYFKRVIGFSRSWYARYGLWALRLAIDPGEVRHATFGRYNERTDVGPLRRNFLASKTALEMSMPEGDFPTVWKDVVMYTAGGHEYSKSVFIPDNDLLGVVVSLVAKLPLSVSDVNRLVAGGGAQRIEVDVGGGKTIEFIDYLAITNAKEADTGRPIFFVEELRRQRNGVARRLRETYGDALFAEHFELLDYESVEGLMFPYLTGDASSVPAITTGDQVVLHVWDQVLLLGKTLLLGLPTFGTREDCIKANSLDVYSRSVRTVRWRVTKGGEPGGFAPFDMRTNHPDHPLLLCPEKPQRIAPEEEEVYEDARSESEWAGEEEDQHDFVGFLAPGGALILDMSYQPTNDSVGSTAQPRIVELEFVDSEGGVLDTRYFYNAKDRRRAVLPCVEQIRGVARAFV